MLQQEEAEKTIKVTEFVTTAELSQMMDVAPTQIISACFYFRDDGDSEPAFRC